MRNSELLQKLHGVEREIAKVREQALYRNRVKDTCLLQEYSNGNLSLILNVVALWEVDDVPPVHSSRLHRGACVQFTVCISSCDAKDMCDRVESEEQHMFVGDIDIVKGPDDTILPSFVRLDLLHDAFVQRDASSVYIDAVKGSVDLLPHLANWKSGFFGDFLGEQSANCAVPCEVESTSEIVERIPCDQRQVVQNVRGIWNFVYQRLSALSIVLDCGSASMFERNDGGCKVRAMFIGPLNLQVGVSKECTHSRNTDNSRTIGPFARKKASGWSAGSLLL